MPKKTIKEMSRWELRHYSLETKTFRAVLMGSLLLGIVALILGVGLYVYSLGNQYISEAFNLSKSVTSVMNNVVDASASCRKTMEIYHSLSEDEREALDDEYFEKYSEVMKDPNYDTIMEILGEFAVNSDINDIYIGMYDYDTGRLVYVADPDTKSPCPAGYWDDVSFGEIDKFLNWDGKGTLYNIAYFERYGWICTSGAPIYDEEGTIAGFVLADVSLTELINGMKRFVLQYFIATAVTVAILCWALTRHIRKTMVAPINRIATAAGEYVKDKRRGESASESHFEGLKIDTGDEIENLYFTLSDMENDLNAYEKDLTKAVQEKERIGTELDLANRIQEGMLPNVFPAFPDRKDFDIYGTMIPAKEVGGDFYDFFLVDDDHLCMTMADVSGKGVPAALFMMASKILIKVAARTGASPAEVLEKVNDQICGHNPQEMFVTVWLGVLELSTGRLTAVNAGHEYPMVKHGDGSYEMLRDKHGFVVGGMEGTRYSNYDVNLEPGSELFLYTDGVAEAANESKEMFGTARLLDVLNKDKPETPQAVLNKVRRAVNDFVGEAPQFDDITMLCLSYIGSDRNDNKAEEQRKERFMKEMTLEATVNNIPMVTEFVNTELEALDCPVKAQMQIDVAIDELFGNIAQYAYDPLTGPATVRVEVDDDPMAVIITFIDNGKPFDPLKGKDPDTTLSAEERQIGGLGVFLVKKTMDEITYEYKDGQNILKIRKNM